MTLKNNRAPLLCNIKIYASFHHHMWIQTGVTVRKQLSWVVTSVTLTFDLWPWPFAWTLLWSLVITPENFMMIRWWEHSKKGVTGRQTDGRTENTICRAADITCPLCSSNEVGDESHYLFVCNFFKAQRDKYIPVCLQRLPHTTVFKNLFTKSETITNVARFAKIIMSKFKFRKSEIVNSPCKKQITTCSGRVVKQPVRLSL